MPCCRKVRRTPGRCQCGESRGRVRACDLFGFSAQGDRRPGVEDLIAWRKHSSPNRYGQALTAKDAKDARKVKGKNQVTVQTPCKNLRCDWPVARYPNSASPSRYCLSLASLASLAVDALLVRRSKPTENPDKPIVKVNAAARVPVYGRLCHPENN